MEKRDELLDRLVFRLRRKIEVHDVGREQFPELHMCTFEGTTLRRIEIRER